MGIFGQNCEFVAKNPLFSLISCEKKLKILYSLRKKVGKWAEGVRCAICGREINIMYNERHEAEKLEAVSYMMRSQNY